MKIEKNLNREAEIIFKNTNGDSRTEKKRLSDIKKKKSLTGWA